MISRIRENQVLFFLVKAFGLFLIWLFVYKLWLSPQGKIDGAIINNIIFHCKWMLELMGYTTFQQSSEVIRTLGIDGSHGVWVGDPCDGMDLFALFTGFVIAFPGPWKKKAWFIPLGLLAIHILNIFRVTALIIIAYKSPEWLDFNHTYTFTIIVYVFIFWLWMIWANKLSRNEGKKHKSQNV